MIVLDTNVVSEPLRDTPDSRVIRWLDRQSWRDLYLTTVNAAELLSGAEILPVGQKRSNLQYKIAEILRRFGEQHILPFDMPAARSYAVVVARTRRSGFGIGPLDARIAAIAAARGFAVATRDTAPFIAAGVPVLDPWHGASA